MILRRAVKIQLIVFIVLALVGTTYTGASYVGIGRGILNPPFTVTAQIEDTGGIFVQSEVSYRGVVVGRVAELRLIDGGTAVDMEIENDYLERIPAERVRALVANKSAVGEQFIDILPQTSSEPFLEDGSVIPFERTETPILTDEILAVTNEFVKSVDLDALRTTVDELDQAFSGTGPVLQRLIDDGNALTNAAIENLPQTRRLITDGTTVLQTQVESREEILSFSADLADFSRVLRESDEDLRRLFDTGEGATRELDALLTGLRPTLPQFLANLDTLGQITRIRIPAIEQIYVIFPAVVAGNFTVVPGDETAHFGLATTQEPHICPPTNPGYDTQERPPEDTRNDVLANQDAYCEVPPGDDSVVRGARNAPRPPCVTSGPWDTSRQTPRPAGAVTGPDPACTEGATASGASATTDGDVATAMYDPRTGDVHTADGVVARIGTFGGQASVLGSQSWKAMLLSPLSS